MNYGYAANSNKLLSMYDQTNSTLGFKDGNMSGNDYDYDANGNMIEDKNKNISKIYYNHLNLPVKIEFGTAGQNEITYLYNAAGVKVGKKVITINPGVSTVLNSTDYFGGFQYLNNELKFFPTAEGYVSVTGGDKFNYVYNYTDHLGNIRLSYSRENGQQELKILEQNHYYPFGLKHSYNVDTRAYGKTDNGAGRVIRPVARSNYQYKYNGKEFQDELGLNLYDYGARNYDPALGRYMNIDAYSDLMPNITPYRYAFNNPIKYIDPDGNFELDAAMIKKYPRLARYLECNIQNVTSDTKIMAGLAKFGQMSATDVSKYLEWGKGPKIISKTLSGSNGQFMPGIGSNVLEINEDILNKLETALGSGSSENLLLVISTILHEFTHYGDDQDGIDYSGEEGQLFEEFVWGMDIDNITDAKKVIEQYKKEQEENNKKKQQGLNNLMRNFGNLEEGTYTWNGTDWVKE